MYDTAKSEFTRQHQKIMHLMNIHRPRTLILNLGGQGRKAGIRYPYWIVTICSFLSSRDPCRNWYPGIRVRFRDLFFYFCRYFAASSNAAGICPFCNFGHTDIIDFLKRGSPAYNMCHQCDEHSTAGDKYLVIFTSTAGNE